MLAAFIAVSSPAAARAEPGFEAVDTAKPHFALTDLAGARVPLAAQRGNIVLVHFFATWCEPCREELPALDRLALRGHESNVRVIAISVADVPMRVQRFLEHMPLSFPVVLDQDRAVARAWDVSALPTTFILDRDLTARLMIARDTDWDRLDPATLLQHTSREDRP